ncbi:MAG: redoxin family protein [Clostridia bacterium]|nr:redoxin family protein [Clostridia bacterium]
MKRLIKLALLILAISLLFTSCTVIEGLFGDTPDTNEGYTYEAFSSSEADILIRYAGRVIPFCPTNEYYFEGYTEEGDFSDGVNYYTIGNTKEEFEAYLDKFDSYTAVRTYRDDKGAEWHELEKDGTTVDISYYSYGGEWIIDVFARPTEDPIPEQPGTGGSGNTGGGNQDGDEPGGNENPGGGNTDEPGTEDPGEDSPYKYNDFSAEDKALFTQYIGRVIPFLPNDEYYIEGYTAEADYEHGLNFYTIGNTEAQFTLYRALFELDGYLLTATYEDDFGDTWYTYEKEDVVVDLSYYLYENESWVDVYIYSSLSTDPDEEPDDVEPKPEVGNKVGNTAPVMDLQLIGKDGSVSLEDYKGRTVVINFWGTWCPYCLIEMPHFDDVASEYADELTVLAIHNYDNTSEAEDYIKENYPDSDIVFAMDTPVSASYDAYYSALGGKGSYPMTVIVNADGVITFSRVGAMDHASLIAAINTARFGTGEPFANNEFSEEDKALFTDYIGEVIPFLPNNEYYIEGYYEEADYEHGLNFYTMGNTEAHFQAYLGILDAAGYQRTAAYEDDYGDTWYTYEKGGVVIDLSYYLYEGVSWVDVYIYSELSTEPEEEPEDTTTAVEGVLTNDGKGLPEGLDGVHDVDLTKAEYAKNVTETGYYLDGCPTVGSPAVLVIPVEFSDITAESRGYSIDAIKAAFLEGGVNDYHSVYDYYFTSSWGQLTLDITVLDEWFMPSESSAYYEAQTMEYFGAETAIGDQMVIDEALRYLEGRMDLSAFDSDGNGMIDAVVIINTLEIDSEDNFNRAYRYWNIYTDAEDNYYTYDDVSANDYMWASFQFLHEDELGGFDDESAMNTYTYIHEFGHVLGADDYYDTAKVGSPMDGRDVMDSEAGDHNAFTKMHYGWLDFSRLIVGEGRFEMSLGAFITSGDTILLAANWDDALGLYQEYFIITYYRNIGLNEGENAGYFETEGIVIYHVNASLYADKQGDVTYYDPYYNNTDPSDEEYGTAFNLIELVSIKGHSIFGEGDSVSGLVTDGGTEIPYRITVGSLADDNAELTITYAG